MHQQFLEGQEASARILQDLVAQQRRILEGGSAPSTPVYVPRAEPVAPVAAVSSPPVSVPMAQQAPAKPVAQEVPKPSGAVEKVLLDVVAEKTGYPVDMLELDMGLDADLGIDSIKRVEILSALQERLPDMPSVGSEDLGSFVTLRDVAEYLGAGAGAVTETMAASGAVEGVLLDVVAEKTGYPVDMLELDMGLDADLGIDSIKRVEILSTLQERLPNVPSVGSEDLGSFVTLRDVADYLGAGAGTPAVTATAAPSVAVEGGLLEVVAEKTGYPVDMLELDMGLDADLGIDSIKRVEILSALQERMPELPAVGSEDLGFVPDLAGCRGVSWTGRVRGDRGPGGGRGAG